MELRFTRSAARALIRLKRGQPDKARTIREQIGRVAANPMAPNNNVKPLKGIERAYRLRSATGGCPTHWTRKRTFSGFSK
jgi:hypothetical protein